MKMKVQKRMVSTKRHTKMYKIAGKWMSRTKDYDLARVGKIEGVAAYRRGEIKYIQSLPGHTHLYDLPIAIES
jgi:hypothetical protein